MSKRNLLKSNQEIGGTSDKYPGESTGPISNWNLSQASHHQLIIFVSLGPCGGFFFFCLLHSVSLFQMFLCFCVAPFSSFYIQWKHCSPNLTSIPLLISETHQNLTKGPLPPIQVTAIENSHGIRCISPISNLTINGLERIQFGDCGQT